MMDLVYTLLCFSTISFVASIMLDSLLMISLSFSFSVSFSHSITNLLFFLRARPRICTRAVTVDGGYILMTRSHSGQSTPSSATDVAMTTCNINNYL